MGDELNFDIPRINKVKNVIRNRYVDATCGLFFNRNWAGDPMSTIWEEDGVTIDICYNYEYFEVFGLTEEEEIELLAFYDSMKKNFVMSEDSTKKKETDYHAKQDYGKAKLSLVPRRIIWDVAAIREYRNNKYPDGGPDNWRSVEPERYRDAAYRHFLRYLDDPRSVDSESGFPHLWHLACNIAFLCEMEDMYLSKNPEVVERLKKEFRGYQPPSEEVEGPTPPRDWRSAQTDE